MNDYLLKFTNPPYCYAYFTILKPEKTILKLNDLYYCLATFTKCTPVDEILPSVDEI